MQIKTYVTGPIQVNTYVLMDEESQEAVQVEENADKETIEKLPENTDEAPLDVIDASVLPPVAVIEE